MACIYSHLYMGTEARINCSAPIKQLLEEQEAAYYAGLIGPDPFFFDAVPPPLFQKCQRYTGNRLHGIPGEKLLDVLLPLAKGNKALSAYAIGFLGHLLLDSCVHPYVISHFHGKDHTRFEARVEQPLLTRFHSTLWQKKASFFFQPLMRDHDLFHAVDDLVCQLSYRLDRSGTPGAYRRSYQKHLLVQNLFFDPKGTKRQFFGKIENLLHLKNGLLSGFMYSPYRNDKSEDLLNDAHSAWISPKQPDIIRTEAYPELIQQAINDAPMQYALAYAYLSDQEDAQESLAQLLSINKGRTMSYGYAGQ